MNPYLHCPACLNTLLRVRTSLLLWRNSPIRARAASFLRFLDHTHTDTPQSVGLLWTSDRLVAAVLYLTTHSTQKRQTSMHPAGFKPEIPTSERRQTVSLDRSATGGHFTSCLDIIPKMVVVTEQRPNVNSLECIRVPIRCLQTHTNLSGPLRSLLMK